VTSAHPPEALPPGPCAAAHRVQPRQRGSIRALEEAAGCSPTPASLRLSSKVRDLGVSILSWLRGAPFSLTLAGSEGGVLSLTPARLLPQLLAALQSLDMPPPTRKDKPGSFPRFYPETLLCPHLPLPPSQDTPHTCFREEGEFRQAELSKS